MTQRKKCLTTENETQKLTSVKSYRKNSIKMIFTAVLLLSCVLGIGCQKVELKKNVVETVPLKFEKGTYDIVGYRLKYPEKLLEKENFWQEFDAIMKLQFKFEKKYVMILNEEFFRDFKLIKEGELLLGEEIINKVASSLSVDELDKLKVLTEKKIVLHSGTVQEGLNLQIFFLRKVLDDEAMNKNDPYDESKLYTELYKEELINQLKLKRQKMLKILEKIDMELVAEIKDVYKPITTNFEYKKYYFVKDIILQKEISFDSALSIYKEPVLISYLKEDDLSNIIKKEIGLKNRFVIINNKKYNGYKYLKTGDLLIFVGGEEELATFPGYRIKFKVEDKTLKELLESKESSLLKRIFGGK